MELKYDVTQEAYIDFNMYHIKNSKTAHQSLQLQRFIGPVIFLLFPVVFSAIVKEPLLGLFILFFIMSIVWIVFYPRYFYGHVNRMAMKMLKEGKNDGLLGPHEMVFTDKGLLEISSKGETFSSWHAIEKFGEDERNLYLYNSGMSAFIIPKTAHQHPEEVRCYITQRIGRIS